MWATTGEYNILANVQKYTTFTLCFLVKKVFIWVHTCAGKHEFIFYLATLVDVFVYLLWEAEPIHTKCFGLVAL